MSRKDYKLLASTLRHEIEAARGNYETFGEIALCEFGKSLASALAGDNPRFDRGKFLAACGIES